MKHFALRVVALAMLAGLAWLPAANAQDEEQPNAVIEETNVDLGQIYEQEKYTHVFKVKNTGKAKLYVTKVKPG